MRALYPRFFIVALCTLLCACSTVRTNPLIGQKSDASITKQERKKTEALVQSAWNKRHTLENLKLIVQNNPSLALASPPKSEIILRSARAEYLLGEFFSEVGSQEQLNHFESASHWSELALSANTCYHENTVLKKLPPDQGLNCLRPDDAPALFWFAVALGKWASTKGVFASLKYKDIVKRLIDRVFELSPNFYYGGVHRYYGAYYALLPGFSTNDLELSKKHFEAAIKIAPEYYSNHVLYAMTYARKTNSKALFKNLLTWVVEAKPNPNKDIYPEQLLEKTRASTLLEGIKE